MQKLQQAVVGAVLVVLALGVGAPSSAQAETEPPPAGRDGQQTYIVRFRPGVDAEATVRRRAAQLGEVGTVLTNVFPGLVTSLTTDQAEALADDPAVLDIEADTVIRVAETQEDAPWGLDRIDDRQQPTDWDYSYPSSAGNGVDAYVFDTGIRADHEEFTGRIKPGATVIGDGRGTGDCHGHGTHVAGTIAGTTYGVAKRASIIPLRVFDCDGESVSSGLVTAIDWVIGRHTAGQRAVANLSLTGRGSATTDAAISRMVADGIVVVAAAGNDSTDACQYSPARAPAAITVGATDAGDWRSGFSNYGRCLDIFAPGERIHSAWIGAPYDSRSLDGTSMASPHVAGAAAVLWGQDAGLSSATVASRVVANSTTNLVQYAGAGSPNRLLHSPPPPIPRPANDDLAAATPIEVSKAGSSASTTRGATVETGEPNHNGSKAEHSIWWTFTATSTGQLTLSTSSTLDYLALVVYTGSTMGNLTKVASSIQPRASVTIAAVGGQTYRVAVDAFYDPGPVTLVHGGLGTSSASPWWPLSTPAKLVDRHFRDLVGRAPTAAELTTWTTKLMNGSATGSSLVTSLRGSTDNIGIVDPTVRLYRAVLRRTPDQAGLTYWLAQRRTGGWSLNRAADFFVRSQEFVARYGSLSNQRFVTLIYTDILERPGDVGGITYWTSELDRGRRSRGQVLLGFTESAEYRATYAHHVDATVAYSSLLKRPPTATELATWVSRRTGGSTHAGLVKELLLGDEYRARGI